VCVRFAGEPDGMILKFGYKSSRRGEKVIKKSNGNIIRERRGWKENRDNCIRVLSRDGRPDLGQIEIIRANKIGIRRKGSGALWKLLQQSV